MEFRLLGFRARDYYAIPEMEEGLLGRALCGREYVRIELVIDDEAAVTVCAMLLVAAAHVACRPAPPDLEGVYLRRVADGIRMEVHTFASGSFNPDDIQQLTPILLQSMSRLMGRKGGIPPLARAVMDAMTAEARTLKVAGLFANSLAGATVAACRSPMANRLLVQFGDQEFPARGLTESSGHTPFSIAWFLSAALADS